MHAGIDALSASARSTTPMPPDAFRLVRSAAVASLRDTKLRKQLLTELLSVIYHRGDDPEATRLCVHLFFQLSCNNSSPLEPAHARGTTSARRGHGGLSPLSLESTRGCAVIEFEMRC